MMFSKLFNQSNSKFQPELNHLPALQLKFFIIKIQNLFELEYTQHCKQVMQDV